MLSEELIHGYIAVMLCIIFFGTSAIPLKFKSVHESHVHPIIFQLYTSIAIAFCGLFILFVRVKFIWLGALAAALWTPAGVTAKVAIERIGIAMSQGLWCGCIIVVSFIWGVFVFNEPIKNSSFTSLAITLLLVGIFGISMCKQTWEVDLPKYLRFLYYIPVFIPKNSEPADTEMEMVLLLLSPVAKNEEKISKRKDLFIGILCAATTGIISGSLMVPAQFVSKEYRGWDYVFSFSIGSFVAAVVLTFFLVIYHYIKERELISFHVRASFLPGLLSGLLFSAGNTFRVFAVLYLGMAVGFPLTQLSLILAGLIGMIFFKEFTTCYSISLFSLATMFITAGAVLLAIYGRGFD